MTFQQFLQTYNGQQEVGSTSENIGQCTGLVNAWTSALNLPFIWGNACDMFVNADEQFYTKILNTPEAIPQQGDIVCWSAKFNATVGHVGICTGTGDINTFECFEQNDPLGSNCHLKTYNYKSVIGWLRPKPTQNEALDACLQQHTELVTKLNAIDAFRVALTKSLGIEGADWQRILDEINLAIKERDDSLTQASMGDRLWDALVSETGLQVVKYTPESEQQLLEGLKTLKLLTPEDYIKIKKEEYDQLNARKTLDRFSWQELVSEIFNRLAKWVRLK